MRPLAGPDATQHDIAIGNGADQAVILAPRQEAAVDLSHRPRGIASLTFMVIASQGWGTAAEALGGTDILVNNAAHQASFEEITDIGEKEWERTFQVNIHAMFYLTKAAVPHPTLLAYPTTKGAIRNFTAGLAQLPAKRASGPIPWRRVRSGRR